MSPAASRPDPLESLRSLLVDLRAKYPHDKLVEAVAIEALVVGSAWQALLDDAGADDLAVRAIDRMRGAIVKLTALNVQLVASHDPYATADAAEIAAPAWTDDPVPPTARAT